MRRLYVTECLFVLWSFQGNNVSLFDGKSEPEYPQTSDDDSVSERALRRRSLPDVSVELDAVSYFQVCAALNRRNLQRAGVSELRSRVCAIDYRLSHACAGRSNAQIARCCIVLSITDPSRDDAVSHRKTCKDSKLVLFQGKLAKKEERWVNIKSLAGHLSQASQEVLQLASLIITVT